MNTMTKTMTTNTEELLKIADTLIGTGREDMHALAGELEFIAASPNPVPVAGDWVMVPRVATPEMIYTYNVTDAPPPNHRNLSKAGYTAMLAAAPSPYSQGTDMDRNDLIERLRNYASDIHSAESLAELIDEAADALAECERAVDRWKYCERNAYKRDGCWLVGVHGTIQGSDTFASAVDQASKGA